MERVFIQSTGKGVNGHRRPCGDTRHRVSDKRSRIQNITTSQKEKTILTGKKKKGQLLEQGRHKRWSATANTEKVFELVTIGKMQIKAKVHQRDQDLKKTDDTRWGKGVEQMPAPRLLLVPVEVSLMRATESEHGLPP